MLIKKIAFGDANESFIEGRLAEGLNIIFSNDNNRGKTLVIQGLMFSLGYDSIFPSSFDYKNKLFYSEIAIDGRDYKFLRKNNTITIIYNDTIQICNSIAEAKGFIDRNIINIPKIYKDKHLVYVDLSLFYEIFFVGQDCRSSAGLIRKGRFNKQDFIEMIYSFCKVSAIPSNNEDEASLRNSITRLKQEIKDLKKKISIIGQSSNVASITSASFDTEVIEMKSKVIDDLNKRISSSMRARQREMNRLSKLQYLISELNSLNKELSEGGVSCNDCGSKNIVYSNDDLVFNVSDTSVRNQILNSIRESINNKEIQIEEHDLDIRHMKSKLSKELEDTPVNFQQIVLYQEYITSDYSYDLRLAELEKNLKAHKNKKSVISRKEKNTKAERSDIYRNIVHEMNRIYHYIDPHGNMRFTDIFTKQDQNYSGSEEQEYYFCKTLALANVMNHNFPIVVDSFRDGEISTAKEEKMLSLYGESKRQVIVTSTLKDEEYINFKYLDLMNANLIDYSGHGDSKILTKDHMDEFKGLIEQFGILLLE
ncbi:MULTISPECIES: hypothetical protein [unclassified Cobetia]|uniref:hypothetical protein n=1 Tax=unclassified Cobetia TaxID=2609414 RepID=UPI00178CEB13|nr:MULTISPECIES: hypothetical protein [unclassified Cobetia]MBE2169240.1 hypothetical protein [Cobetia sp. 2AS1]MDH2446728.1 hypothetical protein [Cobetia sp. 2AS]